MHGGTQPLRVRLGRFHRGHILARGRIRIAREFHVAAKGQRRDLPLGAAFVVAAINHRAKPKREDIGMDPGPASDDIMTVFMDRDDHRQGNYKSQKRPDQPAKLRDQCHYIQNSTLPSLLLRPMRPALPDGPPVRRYQV